MAGGTHAQEKAQRHKFTLAEVAAIELVVSDRQALGNPLIFGSHICEGRDGHADTVAWFHTYAVGRTWEGVQHSGVDCHKRYLNAKVANVTRNLFRLGTVATAGEVVRVRGLAGAIVAGFISNIFGVEGERGDEET
jgi:hypothetical protein